MRFFLSLLPHWTHVEYGGARRVLWHFFHYTPLESMAKHAMSDLPLVLVFPTS